MLHSLWEKVVLGKRVSHLPKPMADPGKRSGSWGGTAPPYLRGLDDRASPYLKVWIRHCEPPWASLLLGDLFSLVRSPS